MTARQQPFLAALMLALSINAAPAHAGILSGADLLDLCEPQPVDPVYRLKISECTGYIVGVSDTFDCANNTLGFNWNSKIYNNQQMLVGTVIDWLHFHPNVLHYQASGLVASALAKQFPCPGSVAEK